MSEARSTFIIDYIDELSRGRSRIDSVIGSWDRGGFQKLASTILSAVACASVPPTVPQIGRSLGHPRQTVQRHVDALVEKGLVAMIDNPDHKTAKRLVPTAEGQALYDRFNAASLAWAEEFAQSFDPAALKTMVETMRAIRHKLEDVARHREAGSGSDPEAAAA
jgi:DNA-binding MarR family transcriptional regulator